MPDAIAQQLARKGWTTIGFPSSEFSLFTLVFEREGARGHANDFEYLAPGTKPLVLPAEPVTNMPDLNGVWGQTRDISLGLSILSGLVAALGGGTLGLKLGFKNARKVTFAYSGLSGAVVSPTALQHGLNRHPLPPAGLLRDWLDDHLYVANGVLCATRISVKASSEAGGDADIDVPVLKDVIGGKVSISSRSENSSEVLFEGAAGVPIALRLYQIVKGEIGGQRRLTLRTVPQGGIDIFATPSAALASKGVHRFDDGAIGPQGDAAPDPIVLDWEPGAEPEELR